MKALMFCLLLFAGQLNAPREVVRLPPGKSVISLRYGGKLVELLDAPADVSLPSPAPSAAPSGIKWSVDIKNLGPRDVTVRNGNQLTVVLHPNQTTTITAQGPYTYARMR